ncbi:MAG TPA: hypothetical protein VGB76_17325, partial [Pyrinomonadaceae bacterium]
MNSAGESLNETISTGTTQATDAPETRNGASESPRALMNLWWERHAATNLVRYDSRLLVLHAV